MIYVFTKCHIPFLHLDPSDCEEGSVRVVNGTIDNEGRVEVCLNGVWGTINSDHGWPDNFWSPAEAYFVCNLLNLGTTKS